MTLGKPRSTRKLRTWVIEQVESGNFPGVCWDDASKTMFRIPWKHAGKQDFREDQDAAFFKAWAIYKGKYREGDPSGPAAWKTRLRCALNKSSEFEEVPEKGRMDVAEPYKVYRLLPPGTPSAAQPGTRKSPSKRHHSSVSFVKEEDEGPTRKYTFSPASHQSSLDDEETGNSAGSSHSNTGSSSNSPEPQEGVDVTAAEVQEGWRTLELLPLNPAQPEIQEFPSNQHLNFMLFVQEDEDPTRKCIPSPTSHQGSLDDVRNGSKLGGDESRTVPGRAGGGQCWALCVQEETGNSAGSSHSNTGSSSNSPEPQEGVDVTAAEVQEDWGPLDFLLPPDLDTSLLLTFIYGGRVVGEAQVHSLDCRLVAEPLGSDRNIEQVVFPKPDPLEPAQRLLSKLDRGLLVASNSRGLFAQQLCSLHISLHTPHALPGPTPHLLPSHECVELFRTTYFCRDLARYLQGLGPPPKFQVTLNFWEESTDSTHSPQSVITVQMEQAFARHLLETPEEQAAILSLLHGNPDSTRLP
ncbi:interferon regulatory factor 9 isoform X2 [Ochotona curzoniae]|uniref:interferon regulatory factor 9 isoform X2 n=1 Tax=Ochotona curzoniae TaxID=130825 RepID=UPI001B3530E2|nr:interferon regulatory factor 9 isoform X2 [Ochotona curzoniae]